MNSILIIGKLLNLKKYEIVNFSENKEMGMFNFYVKSKEKYCKCPKCGKKTDKRHDLKEHKQKIPLRHINLSTGKLMSIKPIRRYFRCNCGNRFYEKFDFESEIGFHTKEFENYVIRSFGYLSGNKIAKLNKVSASKIYKIIENIDIKQINKTGIAILSKLNEIYFGIDEHSFSGNDMVLVITELKTKQLIAVLPKITKESLENWINSIPLEIQLKIKGFSTDMNKGYKKTLENILGKPVHSVDKYHLFQEANKMVDEVRILNNWLIKMNFVKVDELVKLGKIPRD